VLAYGAPAARAEPGMLIGFADAALAWEPAAAAAAGSALGARMYRVTLGWRPGQTVLGAQDAGSLARTLSVLRGTRLVVAVYGSAASAPTTDRTRRQYCSYVVNLALRFPAVNDIVIWNEPNKSAFWRPQFDPGGSPASPAAYVALAGTCWDALHAVRPTINVIGPGTSSTGRDDPSSVSPSLAPGTFIREMGEAYRASRRNLPLFDTIDHHPYPKNDAEPPWLQHTDGTIGLGDWQQLVAAYFDAFARTLQPIPASGGLKIWYLEDGYQTALDPAKAARYSDSENARGVLPDLAGSTEIADQASRVLSAVRLAYCQPYVGAFLNFELFDDRSLTGWQSAPYWADKTRKRSFAAFKQAFREVNTHSVDCSALGFSTPSGVVAPPINVSPPQIAGAAGPGATVLANRGVWNGAVSFAFQWFRCDGGGRRCRTISGATQATYRVARADAGRRLTVAVTARNTGGTTTARAAALLAVAP
jgi:hypothetical protein